MFVSLFFCVCFFENMFVFVFVVCFVLFCFVLFCFVCLFVCLFVFWLFVCLFVCINVASTKMVATCECIRCRHSNILQRFC